MYFIFLIQYDNINEKYKMKSMENNMKQQLNLSVPSAIECIIMTLISMVDTFAISYLGSTVIAAVGAMVSIINFLNLILKSIQVSNNVTIARAIGRNDQEKLKITTGTAVFLGIVFQCTCILLTVSFSHFIPIVFKVDKICLTYLYIRLVGTIPSAISTILSGHLRTIGKSKKVMNVRILSLILNIILDYFAIRLDYGVSGVAWATVIIETIFMIRVIKLAKNTVRYKLEKESLKELLKLAKHGIADRIFDRGGKLVLNIILSRLGTYEYAAHIILNQIESFANDFCYGFGIGITANIGIKIGKNDKKEIKELKDIIDRITIIFATIIPIIIFIVSIVLLPILLKEKETLSIAYRLIPLVIIYSILMPIRYKYSSIIEGMKEFKYNAQISGITNIIKILLAYILCEYIGISGVWLTFSVSYIIIIIALKIKVRNSNLAF